MAVATEVGVRLTNDTPRETSHAGSLRCLHPMHIPDTEETGRARGAPAEKGYAGCTTKRGFARSPATPTSLARTRPGSRGAAGTEPPGRTKPW